MENERFLEIVASTPLVAIDLILENTQGEILLGLRTNRPAQGYWFVPGGRIRKNEILADAFRRISTAELGVALTMDSARLLGAFDHIYEDNFLGTPGIATHYVSLGYQVKTPDDFAIAADAQHSSMQWWPKERLISDPRVHENTKRYFPAP